MLTLDASVVSRSFDSADPEYSYQMAINHATYRHPSIRRCAATQDAVSRMVDCKLVSVCQDLLDHLDVHSVPVIVPRFLLAEIAGAVRRLLRNPIRARLAADAWRALPHVRIVALDDELIDVAADFAADYALRGADAIYVAVAHRYNTTLVSLDREQRERAARVVRTLAPADALIEVRRTMYSD